MTSAARAQIDEERTARRELMAASRFECGDGMRRCSAQNYTLMASPLGTNNPVKAGMKLARVASIESLFACVI